MDAVRPCLRALTVVLPLLPPQILSQQPDYSTIMQLLLPALLSCLAFGAQGFLLPLPAAKPVPAVAVARTRLAMFSQAPSASEAVMLSTNPLAGRKVQFSDSEDSSERVTQVQLNPDGTLTMISDNTNAVAIAGNWRPAVCAAVCLCAAGGWVDAVVWLAGCLSLSAASHLPSTTTRQEGDRYGFILERIYSRESGESTYSMTRIYDVRKGQQPNALGKPRLQAK